MKNYKMEFYSYFDGKTLFSQIFLGSVIFFFFWGGGGGGQVDKSPPLLPVISITSILRRLLENITKNEVM